MLNSVQKTQVDAIITKLETSKIVIDGSPPGSGKTRTALHVALKYSIVKKIQAPILVICPKAIKPFWLQTANEVGIKIRIANYASLKKFMDIDVSESKDTLIILDEIHMCVNDTLNGKILRYFINNGNVILGLSATVSLPYPTFYMQFSSIKSNTITIDDIKESSNPPKKFDFSSVRKLELKKIPLYIKKYMENENKSTIIFTNFNETIFELNKALAKYNPLIVNGLNSDKTNDKNIKEFNKNGGLIILNSKLGGSSINLTTLVEGKVHVIMNIVWSYIVYKQMIGRAYRMDNINDVTQHVVLTDNILDRYMLYILNKKLRKRNDQILEYVQ